MKVSRFLSIVLSLSMMLFIAVTHLPASNSPSSGYIKGCVLDRQSQEPLAGVNIEVLNSSLGAASDREGNYVIMGVPAGNYTLRISYLGYESFTVTDIIVRPDRTTVLDAELKESVFETETISVSAGFFAQTSDQPLSLINFSAEEIRRAPGSAGDVSRIIYGLPSVAKVNDTKNSLIVRGGSALENSFFVDNIEITNINHFPEQGASGGPIGMLNVDLIKDVNFYTGGFNASYGDRLSSVMELRFREGDRDHFNTQLDLGLGGFGGVAEGPLPGRNGSWLFAARRSYLDLIANAIGQTNASVPQYSDIQTKFVYDLSETNRLTLIDVMGWDQISLSAEDAVEKKQNMYNDLTVRQNTIGLDWRCLWADAGYSNTSISHAIISYDFGLKETRTFAETGNEKTLLDQNSSEQEFRLRNTNHYNFSRSLMFDFGLELKYLSANFNNYYGSYFDAMGNPTPSLSVVGRPHAAKLNGFFSLTWNPLPVLTVVPGIRIGHFTYNDNTNVSPRLSLSYQLDERNTLSFSTGIYYQTLPLVLLAQNEENKHLNDPRATHFVAGITHLLTENTRLSFEVYDKEYTDMPADPTQPETFLLDEVYYTSVFLPHGPLQGGSTAHARGVEVMVQKKLAESLYGIVSTSLFRTRYRDLNGNTLSRIYDNRLTFNIEGGYKPNKTWEFSLRWIYAGGAPFTPLDEAASLEANRGIYSAGQVNASRLPDYHSLNLRVDRRFFFNRSNMVVYLSVWNAYGRENISGYSWNQIDKKVEPLKQWSTLPILGVEYEF